MRKLLHLCEAVRAITPEGQITFRGVPDQEDLWVCVVGVGGIILVETTPGPLDKVLIEASQRLRKMSQRMKIATQDIEGSVDSDPPPPRSKK